MSSSHFALFFVHFIVISYFLFFQLKSFDVRDEQRAAKIWSDPDVFGSRASFSIDNKPESLVIKVSS